MGQCGLRTALLHEGQVHGSAAAFNGVSSRWVMDLFLKRENNRVEARALTDLGKALLYYIIAFGLCLGLAALFPGIGRRTPDIAMFTPLPAVLLMLFVFTPSR